MWGSVESWPENESIENYWGQANSFAIRKRKNFAKQCTAFAFPYMAKRSPYVSLVASFYVRTVCKLQQHCFITPYFQTK